MEEKYVGLNSIVGYVCIDNEEFCEVKIVDSLKKESLNEVSKDSPLGSALLYCQEGEIRTIYTQEPYDVKIISIVNPVAKQQPKIEIQTKGEKPIFLENFIPASTDNYASFQSKVEDGLIVGHAYGSKAKDIYCEGIRIFGWDYSKLGYFYPQKLLFDKNCSKEGYSLWFLPYSNLNNRKNPKANWRDFISNDFATIKEYWVEIDDRFYNDEDIRITFASQKNGQYLYLGVFQAKERDEDNSCKTYYKIEEDYNNWFKFDWYMQ